MIKINIAGTFSIFFMLISTMAIAEQKATGEITNDIAATKKLVSFAFACDEPQIRGLLKANPTFNINEPAGTLTAVQLTLQRLVAAVSKVEVKYQDACSNTLLTMMSDSRYSWKEAIIGRPTDFMFLVENTKDISDDKVISLYNFFFNAMNKVPTFDINYQTAAATSSSRPRTVAGYIAENGNTKIWCTVRKKYPSMVDSMDARPNENQYTPLLLAAAVGKSDMVKLLIAEGADWLVTIKSINDPWPLSVIAHGSSDPTIEPWLIQHRQSTALPTRCSD